MDFTSAITASKENRLSQWVDEYLAQQNEEMLNSYLREHSFVMHGPVLVPLEKLQRTIGPEQGLLHSETAEEMELKIQRRLGQLTASNESSLIAEYSNEMYLICDGNHLFEALKRFGRKEFWVIYWEDSAIYDEVSKKRSS